MDLKSINNSDIGTGTQVEDFVSIDDCKIGKNCHIWRFVNMYGAEIGNECMIGTFTEIQENVSMGANSRIQSHSFVCSLVDIGQDVFVGHGVQFTNDRHPPSDSENWESTTVGDGAVIGSNSTILPVDIGEEAMIGAGSVVTENVPPNAIVAGNPAQVIEYDYEN